jgi:hypothetical protein
MNHMLGHARPYENNFSDFGITSIDTGRTDHYGNFRYSPNFNDAWSTETVTLTGRRAQDFKSANDNSEYRNGWGFTWHHVYMTNPQNNQCTMQLVSTALHRKTCPHIGGFAQYVAEELADSCIQNSAILPAGEIPSYATSEDEWKNHAKGTGLASYDALMNFYLELSKDEELVKNLMSGKNKKYPDIWITMLYTPDDTENGIFGVWKQELELQKDQPECRMFSRNGNVPFAENGVGDIFFLDKNSKVHLYLHEGCESEKGEWQEASICTELTLEELLDIARKL